MLLGSLGGLSKRQSQDVLRQAGARVVETHHPSVQTIVLGHDHPGLEALFGHEPNLRQEIETGQVVTLGERELWQWLDYFNDSDANSQLYTPAMLAELLAVPVRTVRRWCQAGLIQPAKEMHHLPLFDYTGLTTARQLARWCKEGHTVQSIKRQLSGLAELSSDAERPLQELTITSEGKTLLLRLGQSLLEASGQLRFTFDDVSSEVESQVQTISISTHQNRSSKPSENVSPTSLQEMVEQALLAEDDEQFDLAIDWYRSALAAFGPNANVNFQLAELLYRVGDTTAARERYYMALELDAGLIEARANLGCVLVETGQLELAVAAFEGTLKQFEDYADVHFHLARTLDDLGQGRRAQEHWQRFVELAPASPWAEEARQRLARNQPSLDF